jgi:putative transcriptional regulator
MSEHVRSEVRKLRFMNGEVTQEELARRVGVSRQTIVAIEGGMYDPSVSLAMRIARVFGVPVEQVFTLYDTEDERDSRVRGSGRGQREGRARSKRSDAQEAIPPGRRRS